MPRDNRAYYEANKDRIKKQVKAWAQENEPKRKRHRRNCTLKRLYGITLDEYEAMLVEQGFACAVCEDPPSACAQGVLSVDHCHTSGRVRGLLCDRCNRALGLLRDSPLIIRRLHGYLDAT